MSKTTLWKSLSLATALACTSSVAVAGDPVELRLGSVIPDNTIWHKHITGYINKVEELSAGEIKINYFGNAQLGTMGETMKMTMRGRLDMWSGAAPSLAAVANELTLMSLPYLYKDTAQAGCIIPQLNDEAAQLLAPKMKFLSFLPVGTQSLGLKASARVPADISNRKIRTAPLKSSITYFSGMGANAVPLAAAETTTALSTGLVEGVDFSPVYYVATGSNKAAPYFIDTQHNYNSGGLIMSKKAWAKLSDDQQKIMIDALEVMEFDTLRQQIDAFEVKMKGAHLAKGGHIIELTAEEKQLWVSAGHASWDSIKSDLRGNTEDFWQVIEAAKANCQ